MSRLNTQPLFRAGRGGGAGTRRRGVIGSVLLLMALALWGCAHGSPSRSDVHGDAEVEARFGDWLERGGEPLDVSDEHALIGAASWYGPGLHGNTTASGESFDMYGMTAAHRSLPFGTDTRQFVVVRINDRGPFVDGRVIDLAYGAASDLGMVDRGVVDVVVEVLELGDGARISASARRSR